MKLTERLHLWDIKRDLRNYESKVKFLKQLIKHFEKKYKK